MLWTEWIMLRIEINGGFNKHTVYNIINLQTNAVNEKENRKKTDYTQVAKLILRGSSSKN